MVTVRSSMQWLGGAGSALLLFVGVAFFVDDPSVLDVVVIVTSALALCFWLSAPLRIGEDEVVIRPVVRARRIPRSAIVATDAVKTQGWPSWYQLRLELADGSKVMVDRVAQLRDGGAVDRARELLAD